MGRTERNRLATLWGRFYRIPQSSSGTARQLVQVYDGGDIPTSTPAVFFTHPVELDGGLEEGDTFGAVVDSSETFPVIVIGSVVPVVGDHLVATAVGGRWVAEMGGEEDAAECNVTIEVTGCLSVGVEGVFVELKQAGVTIFSGTTDSDGLVTIDIGEPDTFDIVISHPSNPRFDDVTHSSQELECNEPESPHTVSLLAAEGYHCLSCCNWPVADEISFSDSVIGSGTAIWQDGPGPPGYDFSGWGLPLEWEFPGCVRTGHPDCAGLPSSCPAETARVHYVLRDQFCDILIQAEGGTFICPGDDGLACGNPFISSFDDASIPGVPVPAVVVCPEDGSFTWTFSYDWSVGCDCLNVEYCFGSASYTFTE